jgi:hypothetical protein
VKSYGLSPNDPAKEKAPGWGLLGKPVGGVQFGDLLLQVSGNYEGHAGVAGIRAMPFFAVALSCGFPVEPFAGFAFDGEVCERVGAFGVAQHANPLL